jgi:hypothetical protein
MFDSQRTDRAVGDRPDTLDEPVAHDGGERGRNWTGAAKPRSLYTRAVLHPELTAIAGALGVGVLLAGALGARRLADRTARESPAEPAEKHD